MKKTMLLLGLLVSLNVAAQVYSTGYGDDRYKPTHGQEGKDVMWLPTEDELTNRMLKAAKVQPGDLVYDLGAGDGKIAIAAARDFGARAVGIEYNPDLAALARRNTQRAGLAGRVQIITGDIFVEDFSKATVVTMYLLPELNLKLRPIILKMKPGTRIVSHHWTMGDWEPDLEIDFQDKAYLWIVPASVEGEWQVSGLDPLKVTLTLAQYIQKVGGTLKIGNKTQSILNARLEGDKLSFGYLDRNNNIHTVKVTMDGDKFSGVDTAAAGYFDNQVSGKRR